MAVPSLPLFEHSNCRLIVIVVSAFEKPFGTFIEATRLFEIPDVEKLNLALPGFIMEQHRAVFWFSFPRGDSPPIAINGSYNFPNDYLQKENQIQSSHSIVLQVPGYWNKDCTTGSGRDNEPEVPVTAQWRNSTIGSRGKFLSEIFILT